MAEDEQALTSSLWFFVVKFYGSKGVLGDMAGSSFVYSQSLRETKAALAARVQGELKDRYPSYAVEQIPADLEPDTEDKLFFQVWEVKPYLPMTFESSEPIQRRMTNSKRAEDMMQSLDVLFQRFSVGVFVERKTASALLLHQVEFPFSDVDARRIRVVKSSLRELTPWENACLLIASSSLQLEQCCASNDVALLFSEIDRILFDEQWADNPRLICAQQFVAKRRAEDGKMMDNLALLLSQYLLFLKKALVFHERGMAADKIDWQERAWKSFQILCVEIAQRVEGLADLDSLSFMSIRPKVLSGHLQKKGDRGFVKAWKRRYFMQRGKQLQYFKSDKELGSVQGSIDLSVVGNVEERSDPQLGPIVAVHVPGRVFLLAPAEGGGDLKFWLDGLRAWRGYLKHMRYDEEEAANAGLMSGNLWKKGVRGMRGKGLGWKQRYFTQIGDSLFYYEQSGVTALGRIDLTDISWIYFPRPNPRRKFKLHTLRDDRIWTLRCETDAELEMWKTGVLKYSQNGPPADSKLARESKDWGDRVSMLDGVVEKQPTVTVAPDEVPLSHSIISEDTSTGSVIVSSSSTPSSPVIASRFVSVKCGKCAAVCCGARRTCSSCNAKLRVVAVDTTTFSTNRRMTRLPPLPAQMPPKSDKVAHQAWKELARRYKQAGIEPQLLRGSGDPASAPLSSSFPSLTASSSAAALAAASSSAAAAGAAESGVSASDSDENDDDDAVILFNEKNGGLSAGPSGSLPQFPVATPPPSSSAPNKSPTDEILKLKITHL